jgi:hypothetical protein
MSVIFLSFRAADISGTEALIPEIKYKESKLKYSRGFLDLRQTKLMIKD